MKNLERYVKEIISDLPVNEDEKEDVKEEISSHLNEHVKELMIKGYTEEEAVQQAITSFGNERTLNWELKKAAFPFYKPVRFVWNVVFVTAVLCLISFSAMEFYHPEFDNTLPLESIAMGFFLVVFIAGAGEVLYEAINQQFKAKWLANPWLFFLIPSLIFGGIQSFELFKHPEQYSDGLWLDLFAIPIGACVYLVSRQLFTRIFVRNRREYMGKID